MVVGNSMSGGWDCNIHWEFWKWWRQTLTSPNSHAGVHFYKNGCAFKWGIPPNGQLKGKK